MTRSWLLVLSLSLLAGPARAEPAAPAVATAPAVPSQAPAFEVNVLWPFFPGGITDLKLLVPLLGAGTRAAGRRGELVLGLHADFATRFVRADDRYGKVSILAVKLGWRQFLRWGIHLEATVDAGWRHEVHNVWDGTTLDAFSARLWLMAGYQRDFTDRVYANVRGGVSLHVARTDHLADKERKMVPGADINLGFRF